MSKELEALDFIQDEPRFSIDVKYRNAISLIRTALIEKEDIDNAKFSEALECLKQIEDIIETKMGLGVVNAYLIKIIKQALLKAQENEKDKVFLKNIGNTKVRVPLVDIFRGLPQEKRFAYTEHIYYHWEEMKESLEAEIKTIKTEKENLESKLYEQKHVLEIVFEKNVDVLELRIFIEHYNDKAALKRYNSERGKELQLTLGELKLLKEWIKCQKTI